MSDYAITMHPYCCYINHSKFAAWYFIIVHMYSSNKECPISFYSGVDKQTSYCNRYTLLLTNTETVFIILGGGAYIRSSRRVAQNSFNPWTKNFSMRTFCQSGPTFILSPESNKSLKKISRKNGRKMKTCRVITRFHGIFESVFFERRCVSMCKCVCVGGGCVCVCKCVWLCECMCECTCKIHQCMHGADQLFCSLALQVITLFSAGGARIKMLK